ncbi:MAG: hypothetical protein QM740_19060 [Acidovorax sp.]
MEDLTRGSADRPSLELMDGLARLDGAPGTVKDQGAGDDGLHASGLRFGRLGLGGFEVVRNRDAMPHARCEHAILNAPRERVGPLAHGLVRNAYCLGSGRDVPAQELNGFAALHTRIES